MLPHYTIESYGGHYGPTLAEQLIDNQNAINMKGLLIGNPGINSDWYIQPPTLCSPAEPTSPSHRLSPLLMRPF